MASYSGTNILSIINTYHIADGTHEFTSNGVTLTNVAVKNITTDANYTTDTGTLFNDITTDDTYMCVRIFHGSLTIGSSVTFKPPKRVKGMFILCKGVLTNNGTISMTGCGANVAGQNVYFADINGTNTFIAAGGGLESNNRSFTSSTIQYGAGNDGTSGTGRLGGGGGGGGLYMIPGGTSYTVASGKGSKATSYSGGGGGGGVAITGSAYSGTSSDAVSTTAAGGNAKARTTAGNATRSAGGGAGSVGGNGQEAVNTNGTTQAGYDVANYNGTNGAGGTLFLICWDKLINNGSIESKGSTSNNTDLLPTNAPSGGASGGGSVNIVLRRGSGASDYAGGQSSLSGGLATSRSISSNDVSGGDGAYGTYTVSSLTSASLRRSLFVKNNQYYWFNGSAWVEATEATEVEKLTKRGMYDEDVAKLTQANITSLYDNNVSNVSIRSYKT